MPPPLAWLRPGNIPLSHTVSAVKFGFFQYSTYFCAALVKPRITPQAFHPVISSSRITCVSILHWAMSTSSQALFALHCLHFVAWFSFRFSPRRTASFWFISSKLISNLSHMAIAGKKKWRRTCWWATFSGTDRKSNCHRKEIGSSRFPWSYETHSTLKNTMVGTCYTSRYHCNPCNYLQVLRPRPTTLLSSPDQGQGLGEMSSRSRTCPQGLEDWL